MKTINAQPNIKIDLFSCETVAEVQTFIEMDDFPYQDSKKVALKLKEEMPFDENTSHLVLRDLTFIYKDGTVENEFPFWTVVE